MNISATPAVGHPFPFTCGKGEGVMATSPKTHSLIIYTDGTFFY